MLPIASDKERNKKKQRGEKESERRKGTKESLTGTCIERATSPNYNHYHVLPPDKLHVHQMYCHYDKPIEQRCLAESHTKVCVEITVFDDTR